MKIKIRQQNTRSYFEFELTDNEDKLVNLINKICKEFEETHPNQSSSDLLIKIIRGTACPALVRSLSSADLILDTSRRTARYKGELFDFNEDWT